MRILLRPALMALAAGAQTIEVKSLFQPAPLSGVWKHQTDDDGVVEAENPQHKLFGFDRTRAISCKSAQQIAEAAKSWGQNDDITVVTVRRNK